MRFGATTVAVLQYYTSYAPATEDAWFFACCVFPVDKIPVYSSFCRYGPWITILTTLFPDDQGFIVTPQRRIPEDSESHIPDSVIEVIRLTSPPVIFRTVLIVKVKNSQHWPSGIPALDRQISRQTDAAFAGTAHTKVYWVSTIGPHWRYGEKDDGQSPVSLIGWHDTTHDAASYADLQKLAALVYAL